MNKLTTHLYTLNTTIGRVWSSFIFSQIFINSKLLKFVNFLLIRLRLNYPIEKWRGTSTVIESFKLETIPFFMNKITNSLKHEFSPNIVKQLKTLKLEFMLQFNVINMLFNTSRNYNSDIIPMAGKKYKKTLCKTKS